MCRAELPVHFRGPLAQRLEAVLHPNLRAPSQRRGLPESAQPALSVGTPLRSPHRMVTKCRWSTSEAPPLTAEICGSAGVPLQVSASWPSSGRLLLAVKMAHVVTAGELLDGYSVLDIECLDRIYLNAYVP